MMNLGALDLVSSGTRFSWTNNIQDIDGISQRLDRVLVSQDWATIFPKAIIINLPNFISGHHPIFLHQNGLPEKCQKRPFRFMANMVSRQ